MKCGFSISLNYSNYSFAIRKRLLGVKQTTQNHDFMYGEFERVYFQSRRYVSIIKFWLKVVNSDNGKLTKRVYNVMLEDTDIQSIKPN